MEFHVAGRVEPVWGEDDEEDLTKLFVTFEVNVEMGSPEGKFAVGGEGSAEVKVGGQTILAELGEQVLCLEVGDRIKNPLQNLRPNLRPKPRAPKAVPPPQEERKF